MRIQSRTLIEKLELFSIYRLECRCFPPHAMSPFDEKGQLQDISVPLLYLYWQFLRLINKKSVESMFILKMRT